MTKPNIIFLNHKEKACGVYQYGYRSGKILQKSNVYNFIYTEVENEKEFIDAVNTHNPIAIIYNFHTATLPWLGQNGLNRYPNLIHLGLWHEGVKPTHQFNYILYVDSSHPDENKCFSIPRPLFDISYSYPKPTIPTFSSFGFGFNHKGFEKIVKLVNDQFDEAIIRLHMSNRPGTNTSALENRCQNEIKKEKIKLVITNDFLTDDQMLDFLATSTANIFLYDKFEQSTYGLSSVIDYALSVDVPLIINKSNMFIHINKTIPSICVEDRKLLDIVNSGTDILQQYKDKWSNNSFVEKFEYIINKTC